MMRLGCDTARAAPSTSCACCVSRARRALGRRLLGSGPRQPDPSGAIGRRLNIAPPHLLPVLAAFDAERRSPPSSGVECELLPAVTRIHGLAGGWHQIAFSALSDADADSVIAEQAAYYRTRGISVEWSAYAHDTPRDLLARLARHGFDIGPREAVVVLDCRERPPWLGAACAQRVERVRTGAELRAFGDAAERIFQSDQTPVIRDLEARLAEPSPEHVAYLVYDGNQVGGVARLQLHRGSQFATLYGGGTLEAHRGRGLYRAAVQRRALDAVALGARYLRVDALPTSQPILEQLGFEVMTYVWPCALLE